MEVGGKRYYDLTKIFSDAPTESLQLSLIVQMTEEIQVGGAMTGTINALTKESLQEESFAGLKIGGFTLGHNSTNDDDDDFHLTFSIGGYLAIGGEIGVDINVSKIVEKIFGW